MKIYVKRGMWQTVAIFITCVLLLYLWLTGLLKHKAEHSLVRYILVQNHGLCLYMLYETVIKPAMSD